jgi:hypothetical protein
MNGIQDPSGKEWMDEYRAWEAGRALRAQRLRGLADRVSRALVGKRPLPSAFDCPTADGPRHVPVTSIVGVAGHRGPGFLPLPRRAHVIAWRMLFVAEDLPLRPVMVEPAEHGWLLSDPADALLVHVLKARGVVSLAVCRRKPDTATVTPGSSAAQNSMRACTAARPGAGLRQGGIPWSLS